MATTIYPAKVAVLAMLEAHSWPVSTPHITWGAPTESEDVPRGGEMIYLREVEVTDDFVTLGASRLDESFALPVVIDVIRYGDDEQQTEARAWVLRDEIIGLLRGDPTLGGAINRISGFRVRPTNFPGPQTWRTQIVVEAACVGLEYFT